jgi:hypothetical protein
MAQLNYDDQAALMLGKQLYTRKSTVDSPVALSSIPVGFGTVYGDVGANTTRLPTTSKSVLLFDADFVASNTIDLDVNGVSIAQVTYATSHDNTADLLVAAIDALDGIACVLDSDDANNRTFIVTSTSDVAVVITSVVVAAGASQAGSTVTTNTNDKFRGVALQTHTLVQDENGLTQYVVNDVVSDIEQGGVAVWVEEAVTEKDPVYLRFEVNGASTAVGYFRTDADTNKAMLLDGVQFKSRTTGAGLVKLNLNLPA